MIELIIILVILIAALLIGYFAFNIRIKEIKKVGHSEKLDKISSKFPENKEICAEVLQILNNTKVKIKEELIGEGEKEKENKKDSLYVAISDTIFIGNINDTYTRIQTICHECLHSIQPKRLLLFNFIYSNIYIFYFLLSIILTIIGIFKDAKLQIIILTIMGFIYYAIRAYLENDAMIKAKYLAKDYMMYYIEKNPICTKEDVEEITEKYDEINLLGIPTYNYMLMIQALRKVIIFTLVALIKTFI